MSPMRARMSPHIRSVRLCRVRGYSIYGITDHTHRVSPEPSFQPRDNAHRGGERDRDIEINTERACIGTL